MSFPAPPFEWESLKYVPGAESAAETQRYNNISAQWRHFEPFFLAQGYTLLWSQHIWENLNLPIADDPLRPGPAEDFVTMPFGHSKYHSGYDHPSLYGALDRQGRKVVVKVPRNVDGYDELDVVEFLRQGAERRDPRDHTLPVLDILVAGPTKFMVMPVWGEPTLLGPFWDIAEVLDCFEQLLTGLVYLHSNRVAHRDIHADNIYVSIGGNGPMNEPGLVHFRHKYPVKYAYADFGLASRFALDVPLDACKVVCIHGVYRGPEQSDDVPYNPFALDVYQLGQTFHRLLWDSENTTLPAELRVNVPQLSRLMRSMILRDPDLRPASEHALQRLQHIRGCLDGETLGIRTEFLDPDEMMPNCMKGRYFPPEPI